MSPVLASVEQEEALNAEREAREAREVGETLTGAGSYAKVRGASNTPTNFEKCRADSESASRNVL